MSTMNRFSRVFRIPRDRVHSVIVMVLAQAINAAAIVAVTQVYAPGAFGSFATQFAIAAVVAGISSLRLELAIATAAEADAAALIRAACRLNLWAGAIVAVGAAAVNAILQRAVFAEVAALGAVTAALGVANTLMYARVRDRNYRTVAVSKLVTATVQAAAQIGLGLLSPTASVLLAGSALSYAASAALLFRRLKPDGSVKLGTIDVLRQHRTFVVAATPAAIANTATMNLPVFVAAAAGGSAAAAHFAIAMRVGVMPSALFGQALMPIMFGEVAHRLRSEPSRALGGYDRALTILVALGCVCLTTLALAVNGGGFLLGPDWAGIGPTLLVLTPFLISQFAVTPLTQSLCAAGKVRQQLLWDVGRLAASAATLLPAVLGWLNLSTSMAMFSAVMVIAYGGHVALSRTALRAAADRPTADTDERNDKAHVHVSA